MVKLLRINGDKSTLGNSENHSVFHNESVVNES